MKIQEYYPTLIWCFIALIIGLQKHLGVFAVLVLFVLFFSIYKVIRYVAGKDSRKNQAFIKLGLWSLCLVVIVAKHSVVHFQVRNIADSISNQVVDYYSKHGEYPQSIEDLSSKIKGVDEIDLIYGKHQDKPFLTYPATWIGFDLYEFNFETKEWNYLSS